MTEQIQSLIAASDFLDVIEAHRARINNPNLNVELSPYSFFCVKTGSELGSRAENSILFALKNTSKIQVQNQLYASFGLNVHFAWVQCDARSLDELQVNDPVGYACYCFAHITDRFYGLHGKARYENSYADKHWSLARANMLMQSCAPDYLMRLNLGLCKLLTFAPDTLRYIYRIIGNAAKTPEALALLALAGTLDRSIDQATDAALNGIGIAAAAIKRARFEDAPTSPSDMARGPSQIRLQKTGKRSIRSAEMEAERKRLAGEFAKLGDIFTDAHKETLARKELLHDTIKRGNNDYRKTPYYAKDAPRELTIDLSELENMTFSDAFNDEYEEDNEIEVRTISRTELPSEIAKREFYLKSAQAPNVPHSAVLDRIRAQVMARVEPIATVSAQPKPIDNSIVSGLRARFKVQS